MKLYVVICYDDEPYVYADFTSYEDADFAAIEAQQDTGLLCKVKIINL